MSRVSLVQIWDAMSVGLQIAYCNTGAKQVFAVDTGYGTLEWKLRSDDRVETLERTNALHIEPSAHVDLVVIDLGWTPQKLALPAGLKWLRGGHIITLVKPHYELTEAEKHSESVAEGLSDEAVERILESSQRDVRLALNLEICGETISPIKGKKSSRKGAGNSEYLLLLKAPPEVPRWKYDKRFYCRILVQ